MGKNSTNPPIRAIYKKANVYPVIRIFASIEEIYELLGNKPYYLIHIKDSLYAIVRTYARVEGKPLNLCTTFQVGNTLHVESAYGDVVVCNYDPENNISLA